MNDSQVKIGAAELPAVTQLFTEPYMVRFLLHNTLGAWWAGKVLAANPALARDAANEDALRAACALPGYAWDYLRFVRDGETWRPAAGGFPGWPRRAAELTVLDPCCGSGHFLTEALAALAALRAHEEGLTPANAVAAVLRDNLAGLEIDGRCVQIASFRARADRVADRRIAEPAHSACRLGRRAAALAEGAVRRAGQWRRGAAARARGAARPVRAGAAARQPDRAGGRRSD